MCVRISRHKQRAFCMPRRFVCTCLAQVSFHHHYAFACPAAGRDEFGAWSRTGHLAKCGKQGRHSWISTRLRRQWHGSSGRARRRLLRQRKRANRYPARRRIASHRRRLRQHKSPKPPRRSPMRPRNRLWTVVLSASQGSSPPELSCSRGAGVALVFVLRVNLQMTHARAHTHTLVRAHAQTHTPQTQTQTQANKTLTHTRQACVPLRVHWLVAEIGRDLSLLPRQREGL